MNRILSLKRDCRDDSWAVEQGPYAAVNSHKGILQIEHDQIADESRIEIAIRRAENDIAWLQQRRLGLEQLQTAITAIRDRTILVVRDVRKNMQRRSLEAERLQESLNDNFLHLRSRFSKDDFEDEKLRRKFLQLLERTPTSSLIEHFRDAVEVRNFACAELIRFEFRCRNDRDEVKTDFESMVQELSRHDPVEMRKRLVNVCKANERVDASITKLLHSMRVIRVAELSLSAVA